MTKHFSFLLSLFGGLLIFILIINVFGFRLVYEVKNTLIFSLEKKQYITQEKANKTQNSHSIFTSPQKQEYTTLEKQENTLPQVRAIFFGDTHFTRGFPYYIKKGEITQQKYFECFVDKPFAGYDIVSANLETSIAENGECTNSGKSISFRTEPSYLDDFVHMGITHFNLANNHSYDCGTLGYEATKKHLNEAGLKYFGEGRKNESVIFKEEIHGIKVAHISAQDIEQKIDIDSLVKKVQTLKQEGNFVIVQLHFGVEYKTKHSKRQQDIAYTLIDNGANLIIGHHPHVIQDVEIYKNVPIFYSLGNFIFDQPFDETLNGLAATITFDQEKVLDYKTYTFTRDNKLYFINNCDVFSEIKNYIDK